MEKLWWFFLINLLYLFISYFYRGIYFEMLPRAGLEPATWRKANIIKQSGSNL